jgi:predicted anti-sigma-YlaC factor YlaD
MISSVNVVKKAVKYISLIDEHVKQCEHCRALLKQASDETKMVSGDQAANLEQSTIPAGQYQNGQENIS